MQIHDIPSDEKDKLKQLGSVTWNPDDVAEEYLQRMALPGEWGDGIVLSCASRLYDRQINVFLTNETAITFAAEADTSMTDNQTRSPAINIGFVSTDGTIRNHYIHLTLKIPRPVTEAHGAS